MIELQSLSKQQSFGPDQSEDTQRAFFCAALDRSLTAELKAGIIERFFALGGCVLNLKFAGDMLARCFVPALAHLEVPPTSCPDAVIHIWDSESTGTEMLPPPCPQGCFTSRGDIWSMGSPRFRSAYLWSEYALNLFDTVTATGMYWTQRAAPLPYWAKASPLRCLFHWWAETKGFQLVHAAAIGREGRAVLITGRGGLGKSTTALSCLRKGLNYIGDDYILVRLDPAPRVHSLYCTAKLNWDQMARFPQLADLAIRPGSASEKAVMYLYPDMKGQIVSSLPLQTVVTPLIGNCLQTELRTISAIDLQRATSFTTMSQLPHASQHTYQFVNRLIAGLSRFQLVLGTNLDNIADAIVQLLRRTDLPSNDADILESANCPLISIIMLVHNGARLLPDAVTSVFAQNYPAIEIIVVDNGSSDDIDDAVSRLPVDVRFLKQHRVGQAAACNRGIREASGEFISFLQVDNLWCEGTLQTMLDQLLDDDSCDVIQGFGRLKKLVAEPDNSSQSGSHEEILGDHLTAAIYRRKVFERVGLFDQDLGYGEVSDWYNRARHFGLKIRQVNGVMLLQRRGVDETLEKLNTLRAFKQVLDQKRETDGPVG